MTVFIFILFFILITVFPVGSRIKIRIRIRGGGLGITDQNVCVTFLNKNAGLSRVESGIEKVFRLSTKFELRDDCCVAVEVGALQVVEQFTTTCGHCDQAAA